MLNIYTSGLNISIPKKKITIIVGDVSYCSKPNPIPRFSAKAPTVSRIISLKLK